MKPQELELKIVRAIKSLRISKNLKQINLARALKISESNYSKIESGKKALTISQLKTISDYLGISYLAVVLQAEADDLIDRTINPIGDLLVEYHALLEKRNKELNFSKLELTSLLEEFRRKNQSFLKTKKLAP